MNADLAPLWIHTATVETYQGSGATGDVYSAAVSIACYVEDGRKLITGIGGEQLISMSQLYCDLDYADLFPAGSRVTVFGRTARVLQAGRFDGDTLSLPSHMAVHLS